MQDFVPENHIYVHTTGHVYYEDLKNICQLVEPKILIPIHTEKPSVFEDIKFRECKIQMYEDGKEIIV